RSEITFPDRAAYFEEDGLATVDEGHVVKRQTLRPAIHAGYFRERGRELAVIECGLPSPTFRIDQDKFLACAQVVAVPEAAIVTKPVGRDPRREHFVGGASGISRPSQ